MRAHLAVGVLAIVLFPAFALAQGTAPSKPPPAAAKSAQAAKGITRDAYIERAKRNAGTRFDRMDADHDGILTRAEIHAYYAARRQHRAAAKAPAKKPSQ